MTGPDDPDRDDDALAAEYVLHLLDADARRAFEARLREEPALRRMVRDWDEALAPMADEIAPVAPPRETKRAIEARLFGTAGANGRAWIWRWGGGALAALALALAAIVFLPEIPPPEGPVYRAEIAAEDRSLLVNARYDAAGGVIQVARVAGGPPPGRVLELWLIAEGADAPVSLGVLPEGESATLDVPEELGGRFGGAVLAVSEEPPGGSPTGAPTGAVLATGEVTVL